MKKHIEVGAWSHEILAQQQGTIELCKSLGWSVKKNDWCHERMMWGESGIVPHYEQVLPRTSSLHGMVGIELGRLNIFHMVVSAAQNQECVQEQKTCPRRKQISTHHANILQTRTRLSHRLLIIAMLIARTTAQRCSIFVVMNLL
eukprot:340790-Amphidinium_carterae.1